VIGVLQLINCKNRQRDRIEPFSTAEQLLAESLSFQAGTHIMHARMHAESEKLINRITKLNQIGISLSSQESTQELLKEILISAKSLTGADAGTLYLHKDDKLYFEVIQTDSLNIHRSSAEGNLNHIEPITLYDKQGNPITILSQPMWQSPVAQSILRMYITMMSTTSPAPKHLIRKMVITLSHF